MTGAEAAIGPYPGIFWDSRCVRSRKRYIMRPGGEGVSSYFEASTGCKTCPTSVSGPYLFTASRTIHVGGLATIDRMTSADVFISNGRTPNVAGLNRLPACVTM